MSAYLHLFVRKNNEFVPIATYGRSTRIYEVFDPYAPWEQIAPINVRALADIGESLRADLDAVKSEIETTKRNSAFIATTDNPLAEKLREVHQIQIERAELESQINEINEALYFISFLSNIQSELIQSELDEMRNRTDLSYCSEDGIYAGIECGRAVSDLATSRAVEEEK